VDFEVAIWNALRSVFPYTKISGCMAHLQRAFDNNISQKGLDQLKNDNSHFRYAISLLMALPYLPVDLVEQGFKCIVKVLDDNMQTFLHTEPDSIRKLDALLTYVEKYVYRMIVFNTLLQNVRI